VITKQSSIPALRDQIARRISDNRIAAGDGAVGSLDIALRRGVARTFRAHWTGYRLFYEGEIIVLQARLHDGKFWSEGYICPYGQASFVLAFRKDPHPSRGTGAERPDDKFASPQSIEIALSQRRAKLDAGEAPDEEIIRYEDFDDPQEAIDQFFNYTALYCLKAAGVDWSGFSYTADPTIGWDQSASVAASLAVGSAIDEGLKRSDIIWLTPDTAPNRPIPCWFVYTKDKRLFVLSGEREQLIPNAERVRNAQVVTRWKGRDARLAEFDASVRAISAEDKEEFVRIGELLVAKRQSVTGSSEENLERWMREAVILELTPRG
jgi:hypothetical protein